MKLDGLNSSFARAFAILMVVTPLVAFAQQRPSAGGFTAPSGGDKGSVDNVNASANATQPPPFEAQFLMIKADWSKATRSAQIETEMHAALKDASVPQDLLDRLPASAPEILFPTEMMVAYSPQHYAELLAWLRAMDLVVSLESFSVAQPWGNVDQRNSN